MKARIELNKRISLKREAACCTSVIGINFYGLEKHREI